MTIPLIILCVGAVASGWVGIPNLLGETFGMGHSNRIAEFMMPVLGHPEGHGTHADEWRVMTISVIAGLSGIGLAWFFYLKKTDIPVVLAEKFRGVYRLLFNKYYIDELYSFVIIRPTIWIAGNILIGVTDARIIEAVVNGVPAAIGGVSRQLRKIQTGLTQHYATIMAAGIVIIAALMLLRGV
jgi:NADH-quinone oxidoreductase subunit L